jgi:large subunit ribosomal protein L23
MKAHQTKGDKLYNVLLAPRVTEKTARVGEQGNQYVFRVATDATKAEIRAAVEQLFDVNVESVQVTNVKGKTKSFKLRPGKRADWKKAYVRVQEGQVIDLLGDAV